MRRTKMTELQKLEARAEYKARKAMRSIALLNKS
jgi:hypothetical protein